jgi:hypothetical protein
VSGGTNACANTWFFFGQARKRGSSIFLGVRKGNPKKAPENWIVFLGRGTKYPAIPCCCRGCCMEWGFQVQRKVVD